jgi:hypothetical protein
MPTEIPVPEHNRFPFIIDDARRVVQTTKKGKVFNQFGLAYSEKEYNKAFDEFKKSNFSEEDIRTFAEYADIVSTAFPDWTANIPVDINPSELRKVKATGVANLAHGSIYSILPENRKISNDLLLKYKIMIN